MSGLKITLKSVSLTTALSSLLTLLIINKSVIFKFAFFSQSFPGMSQQYGVPVGSSVNVMPGPGGAGGSMAGTGAGGHAGPGPYAGPNMQYHPGESSAGGVNSTAACVRSVVLSLPAAF